MFMIYIIMLRMQRTIDHANPPELLSCDCSIDILRKFIRAERTGNWDLYLQALSEMLPFLAASAWAQLR